MARIQTSMTIDGALVTRCTVANRPGAKTASCGICRRPFVMDPTRGWKGTPLVVRETQANEFRGDDKVEFFHPECAPETTT